MIFTGKPVSPLLPLLTGNRPFSPLVYRPTVWLNSTRGLFQDSSFTTPAVADADPVGGWQDQSGNGNHVTQATTTKRPALKLSIRNGQPVIRFDGVDDNLQKVFTGGNLSQPYTTFAVYALRSWNAGDTKVIYTGTSDNPQWADVNLWRMFAGVTVNTAVTADALWHVNSVEWNAGSTKYRLDGGSETTAAANPGAAVMAGLVLGTTSTSTAPADVDVMQVIVYPGLLTAVQKANVFNYLNGLARTF